MDEQKQKEILEAIKNNGGQISVGYLGERLGSKILGGQKTGIDPWKHNLQLLLEQGACKEIGSGLKITSSVIITKVGYEILAPKNKVVSVLKSDYPKLVSTILSVIKLIKEFFIR